MNPARHLAIVAALALLASLGGGTAAFGKTAGAEQWLAGVYVVVLDELPLAAHPSTSGSASTPLDTTSGAALRRLAAVRQSQDAALADVDAVPLQRYDTVLNGFAAELTAEQARRLAMRPDVVSLTRDEPRRLQREAGARGVGTLPQTDVSPDLLGLTGSSGVWARLGGPDQAGAGQVVAVIDSGIDSANPSFSAEGIAAPPPGFVGTCEAAQFASAWPEDGCNNKVVAAEFFVDGPIAAGEEIADEETMSPLDSDGHGSHVAAIAAGRTDANDGGPSATVAGMAPMAHLAAYKACWNIPRFGQTLCYVQDSVAAIEAAVRDGVDVINFSVGGSSTTYTDVVDYALRNASAAGVFVATSAGNDGTGTGWVEHPVPWVTTVAAAHHRSSTGLVPSVAAFSSPGPVDVPSRRQTILKPDLGAPGVSVLSAVASNGDEPRWSYKSGTSMAAPHVAGLAALISQVHPTWSPMAVKSALMTSSTAYVGFDDDDPFWGGAGFTDGEEILSPGLVFDAGATGWATFLQNPAVGYELNAPSVQVPALTGEGPTVVQRTVTNVAESPVTYTASYEGPSALSVSVIPRTFTVAPGQQRTLDISLSNTGAPSWRWQHGSVAWTASGRADVQIPVVARGEVSEEPPVVDRWAGRNRYQTAADIARRFPGPVDTVFLSSGRGFADALSASPIAATGRVPTELDSNGEPAPILLVGTTIPGATREALTELAPRNIVILGGTRAIPSSVEQDLEGEGYQVARVGGTDRYHTAAQLALTHETGVPVAYVASGADRSFADALAGSALAAKEGGPVLLTRPESVPDVVSDTLRTLDPERVVVLGGPNAVSAAVYQEVGASERLSGADRYETAAEVSRRYGPNQARAYVASGVTWPDALAGSVIAGSQDEPVLITRPGSVPTVIMDRIESLRPEQLVVLGGTGAVQTEVAEDLAALVASWR